jgi:putative phosphoesterase
MKIAVISDIHANLPALEAVLQHAGEMKVKTVWCLGDFTGFGANPDQVVLLLKKLKATCIIGNYDQTVLKIPKKSDEWKSKDKYEKWFSFDWSYHRLSKKSLEFLKSLPETRKETIKEWKILLTHGSPDSIDEPLNEETSQDHLKELAHKAHANIILCGHSHRPFMRFAGGSIFVNPGSVGRMFDGDPRASYAVLSIKKQKVEVDFFRIDYDIEREASAQLQAGLPDIYAEMTRRGISLDDLLIEREAGGRDAVTPKGNKETVMTDTKPTSSPAEENVEIMHKVIEIDSPGESTARKQKKVNKKE